MTVSRGLSVVPESELDRLGREIREEIDGMLSALLTAVGCAWRAGRMLGEARALCAHGTWLAWLREQGISQPTAWRCMTIAKGYSDPNSLPPTITAALDALSHPAERQQRLPVDAPGAGAPGIPEFEVVALAELKPHRGNYRHHTVEQLEHLAHSLTAYGFTRNVVIARDGTVLAGHGVVLAAREIGWHHVPVVRLDLDPESDEALRLLTGDNEVGRLADDDERELTSILKRLRDDDPERGLLGSGFDAQQLAGLVWLSRTENEVEDHDHAAEWVGMPEFTGAPPLVKLVLSFVNDVDRDTLMTQLGLFISQRRRSTISAWWPPREREDPASFCFTEAEGDEPADEHGMTLREIRPSRSARLREIQREFLRNASTTNHRQETNDD